MSDDLFARLLKPLPTDADLEAVKEEHRKLKEVIDEYLNTKADPERFRWARQRLNNLLHLTQEARKRLAKSRFRVIGGRDLR